MELEDIRYTRNPPMNQPMNPIHQPQNPTVTTNLTSHLLPGPLVFRHSDRVPPPSVEDTSGTLAVSEATAINICGTRQDEQVGPLENAAPDVDATPAE